MVPIAQAVKLLVLDDGRIAGFNCNLNGLHLLYLIAFFSMLRVLVVYVFLGLLFSWKS